VELRGRTALLTGAAGGLGGFIARALAAEGVDLALCDLPDAPLGGLLEELRVQGVRAESVPADLTDREQASGVVARAEEAIGPLDILVNNAGVEFAGPFLERTPEEIEGLVRVNLIALMLSTRAALPGMLERGCGHVVNIASMAGKIAFPYLAVYSASKHGVVGFTGALRAEHAQDPVGFTAICPGFISGVGMFGRLQEETGDPPGPMSPLPPEAVGAAVVKAIRKERPEVIVNPPGARALIALSTLAPGLAERVGRLPRMRLFALRFAEAKRAAPATPAEKRAGSIEPD
jgi:short-subunit dehydrogenase